MSDIDDSGGICGIFGITYLAETRDYLRSPALELDDVLHKSAVDIENYGFKIEIVVVDDDVKPSGLLEIHIKI